MRKEGFIDIYETDFNHFPIGPGLMSVFLGAQMVEAMPLWRRWWIRIFKPSLWAGTVVRYQKVEEIIREESQKAWAEGCEITFADYDSALRFRVEKIRAAGSA